MCFQGLITAFTGDLIGNSDALAFIYHHPLHALHTLTRLSWLKAGKSLLPLSGKNMGSWGLKKGRVTEGSSFSPAQDPPKRMPQEYTLVFR